MSNLDTLRTAAVLAVLVNHGCSVLAMRGIIRYGGMGLGHAGVLAFFVHTSLVLMLSLDRMKPNRRAAIFYVRRIFRIYPLAVLCILSVVAFKIPCNPMIDDTPFRLISQKDLVCNLLLVHNIIGHNSVLGPLWSLPYEVQMYVVLPFLWVLAGRYGSYCLGGMITGFGLLGMVVYHYTGHANMLAYVPCFLAGVLAYTLKKQPILPSAAWPFVVAAWMICMGEAARLGDAAYMPISYCATTLLALSIPRFKDSANRTWNATTSCVAKYSYGIYLTHVPVLWLVFKVLPLHNVQLQILIWLSLTGALSYACFHLIESPLIAAGKMIGDLLLGPAFAPLAKLPSYSVKE